MVDCAKILRIRITSDINARNGIKPSFIDRYHNPQPNKLYQKKREGMDLAVCMSINLYVCLSINLSIYLSIYTSIYLTIRSSIRLRVRSFVLENAVRVLPVIRIRIDTERMREH